MIKDTITKETIFNANIDKVWNAISKQEEISKWFLKANFKAEAGYQYTFLSSEDDCDPIIGEVISADPYVLIYTWKIKGTDVDTTVKWLLESLDEKTKLTLEHSGISKYGEPNAINMFESFNGGWDNCINGLTNFL